MYLISLTYLTKIGVRGILHHLTSQLLNKRISDKRHQHLVLILTMLIESIKLMI
jgi:hypothetical protein